MILKHYLWKPIFKTASGYFVYCANENIYEKVIFRKTLLQEKDNRIFEKV